ncbi:MAG TPA: glycosyltransferase family protein [Candidatus Omnitrophota bacterium]|nr:glycosyltransferase family protein [Candidatus Omnitrophota bacterium]
MSSNDTKNNIGIIVQARLGSTRFPGKIMQPFTENETVLSFLLKRLLKSRKADTVIVATTRTTTDDALAEWLTNNNYLHIRGSENNCLERFYQTAAAFNLDTVVRITSDCPLVIPHVIDEMLEYYASHKQSVDYLSNRQHTNFPEGLDVEIFSRALLNDAHKEAWESADLEHINYFFLRRPETYKIQYYNHDCKGTFSHYKLSIDTPEDLRRLKDLFLIKRLPPDFSLKQLLDALS